MSGDHSIAIRVTDSGGLSTTQTFTLAVTNVNDKPSVTTTTLPNGTQGQAYTATVTASDEDGTTPTFATPNTSLPAGLALSAAGLISGTPTQRHFPGGANGDRWYVVERPRHRAPDDRGAAATRHLC